MPGAIVSGGGWKSVGDSVTTNTFVEDLAAIPVRVEGGRVIAEAVEINATWHCNISCQWCSHASPIAPKKFADPQVVGTDLAVLANWMKVDHVRILGGEPLLHPHLVELLDAARRSGIAAKLRVLTNGLTLHQADA